MAFTIKENDLLPVLSATLRDANGAVDLSGATSVTFLMNIRKGGTTKVSGTCSILQVGDGSDGSKGMVQYAWVDTDTDVPGTYNAEFEVDFAGKKLTFPNDSYAVVQILPDLNSEEDV